MATYSVCKNRKSLIEKGKDRRPVELMILQDKNIYIRISHLASSGGQQNKYDNR